MAKSNADPEPIIIILAIMFTAAVVMVTAVIFDLLSQVCSTYCRNHFSERRIRSAIRISCCRSNVYGRGRNGYGRDLRSAIPGSLELLQKFSLVKENPGPQSVSTIAAVMVKAAIRDLLYQLYAECKIHRLATYFLQKTTIITTRS